MRERPVPPDPRLSDFSLFGPELLLRLLLLFSFSTFFSSFPPLLLVFPLTLFDLHTTLRTHSILRRPDSLVGALITVPDESWVRGLLVVDRRVVTLLVVEVLTRVALHQLVPALLGEGLAHAAGTVELVLQVHLDVTVVGLAAPLAGRRGGGRRVAAGGQGRGVHPGPLGLRRSVRQLRQIFLQPVQVLLLLLLQPLAGH